VGCSKWYHESHNGKRKMSKKLDTKERFPDDAEISECCGATAGSSINDGLAICSECQEWADFESEEE